MDHQGLDNPDLIGPQSCGQALSFLTAVDQAARPLEYQEERRKV